MALARAEVVEIVAGTTPSAGEVLGLGSFRHDPEATPATTARVGRSFFLWTPEGSPRGLFPTTRTPQQLVRQQVRIFYPLAARSGKWDEVMEQDRVDVTSRLLNETLWNRSTTGIINLATPGMEIMPAARSDAVGGGLETIIDLRLHYR